MTCSGTISDRRGTGHMGLKNPLLCAPSELKSKFDFPIFRGTSGAHRVETFCPMCPGNFLGTQGVAFNGAVRPPI